jgi:hypothetical protein
MEILVKISLNSIPFLSNSPNFVREKGGMGVLFILFHSDAGASYLGISFLF